MDEDEQDQVERLVRFMACKLRHFMRKDTVVEKHFVVTPKEALQEIAIFKAIEEITEKMSHYHNFHKTECCACNWNNTCVFDFIPKHTNE